MCCSGRLRDNVVKNKKKATASFVDWYKSDLCRPSGCWQPRSGRAHLFALDIGPKLPEKKVQIINKSQDKDTHTCLNSVTIQFSCKDCKFLRSVLLLSQLSEIGCRSWRKKDLWLVCILLDFSSELVIKYRLYFFSLSLNRFRSRWWSATRWRRRCRPWCCWWATWSQPSAPTSLVSLFFGFFRLSPRYMFERRVLFCTRSQLNIPKSQPEKIDRLPPHT